jgi:hypothetical protein
MPDDVSLQKLVLLSPGSTTHHSDMHQRYVECAITTPITPNMLQFTVPTEPQAPNGYYMAFALTNAGIPSEATWVLLQ